MNNYIVCHLTNGMILTFNGLCNGVSEETLKKCIVFNHTEEAKADEKGTVLFLAAVPLESILWVENVFVRNTNDQPANNAEEGDNA